MAEQLSETEEQQDISTDQSFTMLPLGSALTSTEASEITANRRTSLIMIAGAPKSGKTTLLASLLHRFQRGQFAGLLFAGSCTLPDLDRRCHLARTSSQREKADTDRTRPGEKRNLLHLKIRAEDLSCDTSDMLFTDLSGEDYTAARNSPDYCKEMKLIPVSDHFVLLLDGEALLSPEKRQAAKYEALALLRCCVESGQLGTFSLVDVLVNKWDAVEALSDTKKDEINFIHGVEETIRERFSEKVGRMRIGHIAVRPELAPNLTLCHGMEEYLRSWAFERPETILRFKPSIVAPNSDSEFDHFIMRTDPSFFMRGTND